MPYEVRAQKCTKSNGESGTHVVSKKGSKKIQSFVVDCTRPVRIDCVARIVVASKSDDDFLFCGEGSPHHRTNVVKIARVSAWSFLEGCEA